MFISFGLGALSKIKSVNFLPLAPGLGPRQIGSQTSMSGSEQLLQTNYKILQATKADYHHLLPMLSIMI